MQAGQGGRTPCGDIADIDRHSGMYRAPRQPSVSVENLFPIDFADCRKRDGKGGTGMPFSPDKGLEVTCRFVWQGNVCQGKKWKR